jgi:hypothetical protein
LPAYNSGFTQVATLVFQLGLLFIFGSSVLQWGFFVRYRHLRKAATRCRQGFLTTFKERLGGDFKTEQHFSR